MSTSPGRRGRALVGRFFRGSSIRTKLLAGFGALLLLGAFNIGVYYWGAFKRAQVFRELQQAIEHQAVMIDVLDRLEDQKKFIDLMTAGVIGAEEATPPSEEERQRFARSIDALTAQLRPLASQTDAPARAAVEALYQKAAALAESWKRFYAYQGTDPSKAIQELYTRAEPLAADLLGTDLPAAIAREKQELALVNTAFVNTDRTFGQLAWASFLISALIGCLLAFFMLRDLLRAITALKTGADRIGAGDLTHRIRVSNDDEFGDLANSFNQMAERLSERTAELEQSLAHLQATQAQLIQAEKMASLGQVTAGIAHEIKNPLNFVNNFANVSVELVKEIEEELAAGTPTMVLQEILHDLKLNAAKIEEHGRRADGIVRAMMQHAHGGEGVREVVGLNTLVEEYVALAYHGMRAQVADFNVTLEHDYDAAAGKVTLVPQEIGRVLLNLLSNAFYAVREQAQRTQEPYAPAVRVTTRRTGRKVTICVEDNGPGIPDAVRAKIFEPFFTTKPTGSGTGLGLSLSYDIVTSGHGGTLVVESEPGRGARFIVTLPA